MARRESGIVDHPPLGFVGLRPDLPVTVYRRRLPHWRQEGATYFVTFRLADSLPRERLAQLREEREVWLRAHPEPTEQESSEHHLEQMAKVEGWLDQGHGECVLRDDGAAREIESAMRHFEGVRCAVSCHVVMPNHVHVVARAWEGYALEDTLQSWKRYSGRRINRLGDRGGERLWQEESFDRIVRDTSHLRRVVRYLEKNAESIGCSQRFWLRPEWEEWYRGAGCAESEFRATD